MESRGTFMSNNVSISVIIPMYNGADNIRECLKYLSEQDTKEEYEVLIVDDASTDNSVEIVKRFIPSLKNASYFKLIECEKNGRAGTARNIGINESVGEYILFIDQDDYPDPRMLSIMLHCAENGKYDMVSCALVDKNGEVLKRPNIVSQVSITNELRNRIIRQYGYVMATLIRRSILVDNGIRFAENVMFEDTIFYGGVICCSDSINNTEEVLYYRKTDDNSQTASFSNKKLNDRIDSTLQYLSSFRCNKKIESCRKEINLLAFYYIYLSVTYWMICIPHLYDNKTFRRALLEGKKLGVSWRDVFEEEHRFSYIVLWALRFIYYVPWALFPIKVLGNIGYRIVHHLRSRN